MIKDDFGQAAAPAHGAQEQLRLFEVNLRRQFSEKLSSVLKNSSSADAKNLTLLHELAAALKCEGGSSLAFAWDNVLPVSATGAAQHFREALVRVSDRQGKPITPEKLFSAAQDAAFPPDLAASFRLWLTFRPVINFYDAGHTEGLSVNVMPTDIDLPFFRDALETGLKLTQACGYNKLILEATEYAPWTPARLAFLKRVTEENGVRIAIDDYGAPQGFNGPECLPAFAACKNLIVKVDGQLIDDFLMSGSPALVHRLRDVKKTCPDALVVAEWVTSAEETRNLIRRLESYGLGDAIDMVQDRDLGLETPASFLKKLSAARGPTGPPGLLSSSL
jgi:EAL domain-containing protein (putative c-di-GMP-specific phosphodiesterase class I)